MEAIFREAEEFPFHYDTLYLGGGTPSLLSPYSLEKIARRFLTPEIKEATLEANPEDEINFHLLRDLGFNRISMAAVSFRKEFLKTLGRSHLPEDVKKRVYEGRKAGFSRINLDLIFGIQGQTLKDLESDLKEAMALSPSHLSLYLLEIPRYFPMNPPEDEILERMYFFAVEFLEAHGLYQYEVSNFSQRGEESLHNLKYWRYEDWIGLGPSAASHVGNLRWENKRSLRSYVGRLLRGEGVERTYYRLSPEEMLKERIMMGLRLVEGVRLCGGEGYAEEILRRAEQYPEIFLVEGTRLRVRRERFFVLNSALSLLF